MKKIYLQLIATVFCLPLVSCKPLQHNMVLMENFQHSDNSAFTGSKAIKLDEVVNVKRIGLPGYPWNYTEIVDYCVPNTAWKTAIEDKILLLEESINDEPFSVIDYGSPRDIRWDVMKKCEMWLYNLDEKGNINKRKIKKNEIIRERLNDSTYRVRLNVQENVAGKILVRKYELLSPYNGIMSYNGMLLSIDKLKNINVSTETKPWIFQKDMPLLHGQFKIYLPYGDGEISRIGDGDMDIKRENSKESIAFYSSRSTEYLNESGLYVKYSPTVERDADLVTVTVSNVMPLPKDSDAQPLGITISRSKQKRDN